MTRYIAVELIKREPPQNRQNISTHTLKVRCVCTDEMTTFAARNILKHMDTVGFTYDCVISTTTHISVSSRTHPHTRTAAR